MGKVYLKIKDWADEYSPGETGANSIENLAEALSKFKFNLASNDLEGVLGLISGPGYKSATRNYLEDLKDLNTPVTKENLSTLWKKAAEDAKHCKKKAEQKGLRAYSNAIFKDVESACGFSYRVTKDGQPVLVADYSKYNDEWGASRHSKFAVVLDHAARRVSLTHTWIKLAEAERQKLEENAEKMTQVPKKIKELLDEFCRKRCFKDWIFPRGKAADDPSIRKVGGLSLTRLSTLTEFRRKIQVGFFTRLCPDGTKKEIGEKFGQSALDALEHLREQRVKQLASRIVEAALGIGRMKRPIGGKDPRRLDTRVDEPCHAVVIENLTRYRPEETRTRQENRQLMTWSSSKIKERLSEACQLHGLRLREVLANYTSRQDSRTGMPGIRCQDLPVKEFMKLPFWRKQVKQAEKKQNKNQGNACERFLCDLNAKWEGKTVADWEQAGVIRVPLRSGEIFVSADLDSPAAKGLQADLNAAANIGLRALIDPDWPGKWWYVPCEPKSFRPAKNKAGGSAAMNLNKELRKPATDKKERRKKDAGKPKEVVNLWRDVSSSPLEDTESGEWRPYAAYQNDVQDRVIRVLEEQIKRCDKQPYDRPGGR